MRVWRLTHHKWARSAFDGQGAYLFGGRWNPKGVRCVYASSSSALAVLEVLVHMDKRHLGATHVMISTEIPDDLAIEEVGSATLPPDWRKYPAPLSLHRIGRQWAQASSAVALRVPSVLVPGEHNILLNPEHPDFSNLQIGTPEPYVFDSRLLLRP